MFVCMWIICVLFELYAFLCDIYAFMRKHIFPSKTFDFGPKDPRSSRLREMVGRATFYRKHDGFGYFFLQAALGASWVPLWPPGCLSGLLGASWVPLGCLSGLLGASLGSWVLVNL